MTLEVSQSMIYLGVDPGAQGGLAILRADSTQAIAIPMPRTERDVWDWLGTTRLRMDLGVPPTDMCGYFAVIERVSGFIGVGHPGSGMFKFGASYGGLRMALIAGEWPFEEVQPYQWQRALGIAPRKKTESKTQWKNRLKAKAQQLFPQVKVTLATADATLICEYCRRKQEGRL